MKTIAILKHEFDKGLEALVNNCGLPACVIRPSVEKLAGMLAQVEARQLQNDLAEAKKAEEAEPEVDVDE